MPTGRIGSSSGNIFPAITARPQGESPTPYQLLSLLADGSGPKNEASAVDARREFDDTLDCLCCSNRMHALRWDILAEAGGDREEAKRLMRQLFNNDEETGE